MDDAVEERAAVVAEGGRAVGLNPELMLGAGVLRYEGRGEGKGREDTSEVTWLYVITIHGCYIIIILAGC